MKTTTTTNTRKYKVTTGIFAGHEFTGTVHGHRIWDVGTVGRSYPVDNCTLILTSTKLSAIETIDLLFDLYKKSKEPFNLDASQGFEAVEQAIIAGMTVNDVYNNCDAEEKEILEEAVSKKVFGIFY